jgi:AcrR family transcriptional regulator
MSESRRKYDAPARRAAAVATRERICAAAEERFLRDGYARTSIRAVARAAGVAEATVYLSFDGKGALLDAVIVRATRDNRSEPLESIASGPPEEILARLASSNAALMARAGRLIALGEAAAFMDAELRPFRARAHRNLRVAFRVLADRLDEAGLLRMSAEEAADAMYAIAGESTYLRMTEGAGLEERRYAAWLGDVLAATISSTA